MALFIRPAAQADLIEIGDYIALDNPDRALTFIAEFEALILSVIAARPDLGEGLRVARHHRYLVFFTHDAERIEVLPHPPRCARDRQALLH
ncbi:type II toxin-antitoxin system RelE/ParE family toxin [Brucella pituitosa]|uniref:type II toxin-antitoxin system RelE/ParE family toxin n=1 Tax=Brucella pituitosa TaxID=571256 RepID=UPI003F4ACE69